MRSDPTDIILNIIKDGEGSELSRIADALGWTEESQRDTERLDWLQAQQGSQFHQPVHMLGTISESTTWMITDPFGAILGEGVTLRAAIDAAMSGKEQS